METLRAINAKFDSHGVRQMDDGALADLATVLAPWIEERLTLDPECESYTEMTLAMLLCYREWATIDMRTLH